MKKTLMSAALSLGLLTSSVPAMAGPDNGDGDITDLEGWKEIACLLTGDLLWYCTE